jgi:hypothetical protein
MRRFVLWLVAVLVIAPLPLAAQQQAGDTELQLQGSLSLSLDDDVQDSGSVFVNYGWFFTDRQEVGASVFASIFEDGDVGGFGGPFYRYNFVSGTTVPYVGAAVGATFGDFSTGDVLLTLEGGVRWFLQRNIAFTLAGSTNYDVDASELQDRLQVLFGFSYIWGR